MPDVETLPDISTTFAEQPNDGERFLPYVRDDDTLARQWALPGTPGLEHRIGGLEKEERTGNISYDPDNHDLMVRLRARKVAESGMIPKLEVDKQPGARLLVLGWGGTYGSIAAVRRVRARAVRSTTHTSGTSTRSRGTSARCSARTTACSSPR